MALNMIADWMPWNAHPKWRWRLYLTSEHRTMTTIECRWSHATRYSTIIRYAWCQCAVCQIFAHLFYTQSRRNVHVLLTRNHGVSLTRDACIAERPNIVCVTLLYSIINAIIVGRMSFQSIQRISITWPFRFNTTIYIYIAIIIRIFIIDIECMDHPCHVHY